MFRTLIGMGLLAVALGGCGGGGTMCDANTQGFVKCGDFNRCQPGQYCSDETFGHCSNGCLADVNCGCGQSCVTGGGGVGVCSLKSACGDGACNGNETPASCPQDCKAGPVCGDGLCSGGETPGSCPVDCMVNPVCGDGKCNG